MKLIKNQEFALIVRAVFEDSEEAGFKALKERKLFDAKADSSFPMLDEDGQGTIYYGLGQSDKIDAYKATLFFHNLGKYLQKLKLSQIHLVVPESVKEDSELSAKVFEGLYQAERVKVC